MFFYKLISVCFYNSLPTWFMLSAAELVSYMIFSRYDTFCLTPSWISPSLFRRIYSFTATAYEAEDEDAAAADEELSWTASLPVPRI